MESIVFHIEADKAGTNLTESIKAYFGNRRVQVIVKPEQTAAEVVDRNQAANHDFALPYDEIVRLANAFDHDEAVDVVAEVQKFKVARWGQPAFSPKPSNIYRSGPLTNPNGSNESSE